jgi:exonuclease III
MTESNNTAELEHLLCTEDILPDVLCIQETFLQPRHNYTFKGYNISRKDRTEAENGGVATLIREGTAYSLLQSPADVECIIIQTKIDTKQLTIIGIYNPSEHEMHIEAYRNIFSHRNAIITGDLNARNPLWKMRS